MKLADLRLRSSTLQLLQQRGFATTYEVERSRNDGGLANLAAELGCTLSQTSDLWRELQGCVAMTSGPRSSESSSAVSGDGRRLNILGRAKTASELLNGGKSSSQQKLITFCRSIDSLLGGGIALGEVTEISGSPGSGKTQLAMQLSVDARLPLAYGGVAGETCFVDTEGNFSPERCDTMARALVDHVTKSSQKKRRDALAQGHSPPPCPPPWFEPNTIMKGIHVFRAHDEAAQCTIITTLPSFLKERAEQGCPVKLLVVDSMAFHYRCAPPGGNYLIRTRSLSTMASLLSEIASSFHVAVVVINQMTTKVGISSTTSNADPVGESVLVPALGESWAHATTTRLVLSASSLNSSDPTYSCTLVKSPNRPSGVATYTVLECGIRDANKSDDAPPSAKGARQ